jgi:PAS domain S-box-containing protein
MTEPGSSHRAPDAVPSTPDASDIAADEPLFHRDALTLAEQSAGVGVWSIDLRTGRVRGTAQFFRIMGLPPASGPVPVEALRALRHPEDQARVLAGFRNAVDGGTDAYEMEYRIVRPDGTIRWIFGRGRVVRDALGTPVRYSGVDLDITDRKASDAALAAAQEALVQMNLALEQRVRERTAALEEEAQRRAQAEARLHQAQKMEAVGQLTGGLAHDFNNILQVIGGNLELATRLLARAETGQYARAHEQLVDALGKAERASRSARDLVQRMLAFSRLQNLASTTLDVNALISDMGDMIRRTLGETIEVEIACAADVWVTKTDRNQLETALLNLVVNARDAMPEGGRLTIRTANVALDASDDSGIEAGEYVELTVTDTGCGIPEELLARVFEPFFTTKDTGKGSGLGLSMVYGFVTQSGGYVRIASEPGRGTSVRILLPRSREAAPRESAARVPAQPEPMPRARAGETVLLVEDNEEVRRFGVLALEDLGYRVVQAPDGQAALQMLASGELQRVHLLFTDVVLPRGMSGPALAAELRTRQPGMPALFTSGYTPLSIAERRELTGDGRLLAKPYRIESLAAAVRYAIDAVPSPTTTA